MLKKWQSKMKIFLIHFVVIKLMVNHQEGLPRQLGSEGSKCQCKRSPGEGNGNPLQYSCLGNPMNRRAWWAIVHGLTKESDTTLQLNNNSKKKLKCTELQFGIKSNISQSENTQSPLYHIILFHYLFSFYHYQKLFTHLFHVWIYLLVVVSTTQHVRRETLSVLFTSVIPASTRLYVCVSRSVVFSSLQLHGLQPARLLCSWDSSGKKTRVGSHSLLQGIFLTQDTEPGSPALQADSLPSEPPGKPWTLNKQQLNE